MAIYGDGQYATCNAVRKPRIVELAPIAQRNRRASPRIAPVGRRDQGEGIFKVSEADVALPGLIACQRMYRSSIEKMESDTIRAMAFLANDKDDP